MFITKKEYENLYDMFNKQNEKISELINMVIEANARTIYATKRFCDLVELIDIRYGFLPSEARTLLDKINNLNKDQG